jgi:plasmid stabilization system protein ParE
MRRRYKLARAARENLREISEYWAGEAGPDAALEVVSGIMETMSKLGVSHVTKKNASIVVAAPKRYF